MVLMAYCKQRIIQLYLEGLVTYGNISQVLAMEGLCVSKKTVWRIPSLHTLTIRCPFT